MTTATIWEGPASNVPVVNANGNIFEEVQVAAAGQTVFTITSFTYTISSHSIFVWKNGLMLRRAVDYIETDSTHITLTVAAALNDKLWFVSIAINQLIAPVVFNGLPAGGTANQVLTKTGASDYQATWQNQSAVTSLLDAARQNIASASTVNLSAIAATTRNIQITGTIQIDGFQVTNGQVWIVRFAASLILKNNANIVTQASQDIKTTPGDTCIIRATADNVVEVIGYSRAAASLQCNYNEFRLSLTTGVPVTTVDVTGVSTIYAVPYKGNKISLWNGTAWVVRESVQFSIALAGLTANRPYDVFCYDNAGIPTLELLAWASATARATVLTTQDGIYVKTGDATRKYLGTFYALSATTTTDSQRQRLVWNYYNRVRRCMLRQETTANWVYASAVIRQANANALNQLEFMCGVQEDDVQIDIACEVSNTTLTGVSTVYVGVNSTVALAAGAMRNEFVAQVANGFGITQSSLSAYALLGFNIYTWLENCGSGSTGFNGIQYSAISGAVFA